MPLRPATANDAASLAALSLEVWLHTYLRDGITPEFARHALATFTQAQCAGWITDQARSLVVQDGGAGLQGYAMLRHHSPAPVAGCSATEIETLYVRPRHQRQGLGRALLGAALDHARGLGAAHPWLLANEENAPALAFYAAHGFATVGRVRVPVAGGAYPNRVLRLDGALAAP